MPPTKRILLSSITGRFPWSTLRGLVDDINAREPANQSAINCTISGNVLSVVVERPLTPAEQLAELQDEREALLLQLRGLFLADGTLVDGFEQRLRQLAGQAAAGRGNTAAPAAPPAVPADRQPIPPESAGSRAERVRDAVINSGFRLPDHAIHLRALAGQHGFTEAEVEEVLGWPAGSIAAVLGA